MEGWGIFHFCLVFSFLFARLYFQSSSSEFFFRATFCVQLTRFFSPSSCVYWSLYLQFALSILDSFWAPPTFLSPASYPDLLYLFLPHNPLSSFPFLHVVSFFCSLPLLSSLTSPFSLFIHSLPHLLCLPPSLLYHLPFCCFFLFPFTNLLLFLPLISLYFQHVKNA